MGFSCSGKRYRRAVSEISTLPVSRLRIARARKAAALSALFDRLLDQVIYGCLFAAKHCVTENYPESA